MEAEVMAALVATPAVLVTAVAAFAAGRAQARSAVDAVRRKDQRDTYARLPHHVRKFLLAMPPIVGTPSKQQAELVLQRLNGAMIDLEDGALQVELEGPADVADEAYLVVDQATDLFEVTIRFLHAITGAGGAADRDALEDSVDACVMRLVIVTGQFAKAASTALNGNRSSRRGDQLPRPPRYMRYERAWPQDVEELANTGMPTWASRSTG
ncbi:hypothetical protein ACFWWS_24965 [Streptomyces sp. NPDC059083]|uniref:hypothetical protein n=1 Tax=unclassified Streptomyces TaxID=2593676 RepID=UPI0036817524